MHTVTKFVFPKTVIGVIGRAVLGLLTVVKHGYI